MPEAMINGGFSPYLAQAFTPQGVPGGAFGGAMGNLPGTAFTNPAIGPYLGQPAMFGVGSPFTTSPQLSHQYPQLYSGWQQQQPLWPAVTPFVQFGGQIPTAQGWPYGQTQPWQGVGQIAPQPPGAAFGQAMPGGQEPWLLAQLLRQYAVPISAVMMSPHGQAHMAQHIVQTAELLMRTLPLVGAPQLVPLAQLLGQNAVPISAAIASPYGQAQIAQNLVQTAEVLGRVLPAVAQSQIQSGTGWQQQLVPQLPIAHLLSQQQQYGPQQGFAPIGVQGQPGQYLGQSGDVLGRLAPFLAQQGLTGQAFGMARV
jgi:hypothetical protein